MDYYFRTKGLTVGYDGKPLIRDIEFRLKKGEILTLIGPNGAGKTTILRSILRQLPLLGGTVYLDGRDLSTLSGEELAARMSVVLTERLRTELMTCEEVVATGRYPYTGRFGILQAEDRAIVRDCMDLVHVSDLADCDFTQISDGQRQRVLLARALCQEPEILLLDEPTSFLDIRCKLEFLSVLQELSRKRNLTVLLSLHELDLAARISDRIACVSGDTIARFGTPEEIFTPGSMQQLYGLTAGTYEDRTGSVELPRPSGAPQVFVLGGCGASTPVYRRLQRENTPFVTGILWENDLDYPAAAVLAGEVLHLPPFSPVGEDILRRARAWIDRCGEVLCPRCPDLYREESLLSLRRYAEEEGKCRVFS